jgi:hypothetical protein
LGTSRGVTNAARLQARSSLRFGRDRCDSAGYGYIGANGHIGPLAVLRPDHIQDAFAAALRLAAAGTSERISAFVPGACDGALSLAVNQGMRITFPMLLMASPGYGDWTRYLPRNPGFM